MQSKQLVIRKLYIKIRFPWKVKSDLAPCSRVWRQTETEYRCTSQDNVLQVATIIRLGYLPGLSVGGPWSSASFNTQLCLSQASSSPFCSSTTVIILLRTQHFIFQREVARLNSLSPIWGHRILTIGWKKQGCVGQALFLALLFSCLENLRLRSKLVRKDKKQSLYFCFGSNPTYL
jgi:hypothetical protein